jgi:hypothetical protein
MSSTTLRAALKALLVLAVVLPHGADACSVMMKTNGQGTFVGRTTDFFGPVRSKLVIIPAGHAMRDPLTTFGWKARYAVVGVDVIGVLGDGINERGVSGHVLLQRRPDREEGEPGREEGRLQGREDPVHRHREGQVRLPDVREGAARGTERCRAARSPST